jgi:catechol 2,3-dioxygenase
MATLQVADLERAAGFYAGVGGLRRLDGSEGRLRLGVPGSGEALLELVERQGARPVPRRGRLGLYHLAFLLPAREELGAFIRHAAEQGVPMGAADHHFSEAVYLVDPDGFTLEIYSDRPRSEWRVEDRQILGGSDPLDTRELARAAGERRWDGMPAGTALGHVHLYVGDLPQAEAFYHVGLGLDRVIWNFPGALFLSAGGYHHHLGVNTWVAGAPVARGDDARLLEWQMLLPSAAAVRAAGESLRAAGALVGWDDGEAFTMDPWGTPLRLRAATW